MARKLYGRLVIGIESATDLPNSDCSFFSSASDPYCIVAIDGTEIGRTAVFTDESNPVWNEEFYLNMDGEGELLTFTIWDQDTAKLDDKLATVEIPLSTLATTAKSDDIKEFKRQADLVSPAGEPAGVLSYSLKLREFGGEFAEFSGDGNRKSLHIGINYVNKELGKGGVHGCHKDVDMLYGLLTNNFGFDPANTRILRDDDESDDMPTRRNIEQSISWLVKGAKKGDSLVFQFSGHGGQQKDKNGDEEDGLDETILPYDHEKKGQITDDDLYRMLIRPLPKGVLLTCIMDCCHSGTCIDLPFVHRIHTDDGERVEEHAFHGFIEKEFKTVVIDADAEAAAEEAKPKFSPAGIPLDAAARAAVASRGGGRRRPSKRSKKKGYDNTSDASVVMISGCLDHQTSAGTIKGGAMVLAFTSALQSHKGNISYTELISLMNEILASQNFSQIPQLSTARPFDLNSKFQI